MPSAHLAFENRLVPGSFVNACAERSSRSFCLSFALHCGESVKFYRAFRGPHHPVPPSNFFARLSSTWRVRYSVSLVRASAPMTYVGFRKSGHLVETHASRFHRSIGHSSQASSRGRCRASLAHQRVPLRYFASADGAWLEDE